MALTKDSGAGQFPVEQCIDLYNTTVISIRGIRFRPALTKRSCALIAGLNFQNLCLTRWGSAVGFDSIGPETNPNQLPRNHPLYKAGLDTTSINQIRMALTTILAQLDMKKIQHDNGDLRKTLKELDPDFLKSNSTIRLCVAVHDIAHSRESCVELRNHPPIYLLDEDDSTFQILDQVSKAIDHIINQTPQLSKQLIEIARQEIRRLSVETEGLLYLNDKNFFKDVAFKTAMKEELPALLDKNDESKARVIWNLNSTNYGFQSSHVSGGTISWSNPANEK